MIQKHLVLFAFIILFALFQLPFFYRVTYSQEIPKGPQTELRLVGKAERLVIIIKSNVNQSSDG